MSCRRSDKQNLIGCRMGDVALRGCGRGCCPYPDSEISQNTRPYLVDGFTSGLAEGISQKPPGRTGVYFHQCQSSYRPKFICPEKTCRRGIKPFFDPEIHEYKISEYQDWKIRPPSSYPEMTKAFKGGRKLSSFTYRAGERSEERKMVEKLQRKWYEKPNSLSREEVSILKEHDPDVWWVDLITTPRAPDSEMKSRKRCPSCGNEVLRVGSNFRIPAKKDEKGWREIERMIDTKEDLVARFSPCATVEEYEKMMEKAKIIRSSRVKAVKNVR